MHLVGIGSSLAVLFSPAMDGSNNARFTEHMHSSSPYDDVDPSDLPEVEQAPQYEGEGRPLGHRASNKNRPPHPLEGAYSPGLESVWDGEGAKEVVPPQQHAQPRHQEKSEKSGSDLPPGILGYRDDESDSQREYCGISRKWFFAIVAAVIIVILGIALGVGLGVGLNNKGGSSPSSPAPSGNPEYLIGGALDPDYYSTSGAFNGSGIALASQSFASDLQASTQGSIVMYFQHHSGQIRWKQLSVDGTWLGGSVSEVVAVDAKNSTPISAVAFSLNNTNEWHIFYVDTNNHIRQKTNSNVTNVWGDGPINDANLMVYDADQFGMQACYYGNDYGDSDYTHTPLPNSGNASEFSNDIGMHMWYASDSTTFQQYGWRYGDESWAHQGQFSDLNGHAGAACYSWGPGTVTYAMFANQNNEVEIYWRDTNTNLTNTTSHPINVWVKIPSTIPNVDPATSLGYTNYFYAQDATTHLMNGYNISWAAENTTIAQNSGFTVQGDPGLPGTHLSVTAIPNSGGGNSLLVFYQVDGDDVTEYTRDLVAGQWSSVNIEIPQD